MLWKLCVYVGVPLVGGLILFAFHSDWRFILLFETIFALNGVRV